MRFYSNGKLLITGEYVILDGALSLAVPALLGQSLEVTDNESKHIKWLSKNSDGRVWFNCTIRIDNLKVEKTSSNEISNKLSEIIKVIREEYPNFLNKSGSDITSQLTFNKEWGLGSSSTLISNLSQLAKIDPYELNNRIFNGSGYDIACAKSESPLLYRLIKNKRDIEKVSFRPIFHEKIYFVYLNTKQNSLNEIRKYKDLDPSITLISEISDITKELLKCSTLNNFNLLIHSHEQIISKLISKKPIKQELFKDFRGEIKSLGAWGGDFIMASSDEDPSNYFKNKGFNTVLKYGDLLF
jgi:mevalonate kinase